MAGRQGGLVAAGVSTSPTSWRDGNLEALQSAGWRPLGQSLDDRTRVRGELTNGVSGVSLRSESGEWVRLHSRVDPIGEAAAWLDPESDPAPSCVVVVGLALGYVLEAIERLGWPTRVIALEPEPALVGAWLARRDWRDWVGSGRLTLLVGPGYTGIEQAMSRVPLDVEVPLLLHPVLRRLAATAVDGAKELVERLLAGARANREARRQFAGPYLLNTLRNLPRIANEGDVAMLSGAFQRTPAIILGAGPTLDDILPRLHEAKKHTVLIAADTALRPMLIEGLSPHLVVSLDPQPFNARHLTALPSVPDTWLVGEGSLDPTAFSWFAGRTFVFNVSDHHPWPWLAEAGVRRGRLRAWGSVMTSAFDLALELGCGPILFAGTDLAYTDGRSYGTGTVYDTFWDDRPLEEVQRQQQARHTVFEADDLSGGRTRTASHLVAVRDWLVEQSAGVGRRVINVSGRGIFMGPSIEQLTVEDGLRICASSTPRNLAQVLRSRHALARARPAPLREAVSALLDTVPAFGEALPDPLSDWQAFSSDTVTPEAIVGALADTARFLDLPDRLVEKARQTVLPPPPPPSLISAIVEKHTYAADGLITFHSCDFKEAPRFRRALRHADVQVGHEVKGVEWRMHTLLWAAEAASRLEGDFVDCGAHEGHLFSAVHAYLDLRTIPGRVFLVGSFDLRVEAFMSARERSLNDPSRFDHTSTFDTARRAFVECDNVFVVKGIVPTVLPTLQTERVSLLHLYMNNMYQEVAAAEFFWDQMVPGGLIVLNGYAYSAAYQVQREGLDAFAERHGVSVLTLATGQGLIVKPPHADTDGGRRVLASSRTVSARSITHEDVPDDDYPGDGPPCLSGPGVSRHDTDAD
jgi:hypothetical protein